MSGQPGLNAPPQELILPRLRDDLQLLEGGVNWDGSPYWLLFDPIRNRFFRIGRRIFLVLGYWRSLGLEELVRRVNQETTANISSEDVLGIVEFMLVNNLTLEPADGDFGRYLKQEQLGKVHWLKWLVHHYLFVRIPLLRPQRFLDATISWVKPFYSPLFKHLMVVIAIVSLYLVARRWDEFVSTFNYFFSFEGFFGYILALVLVKIAHEFGHAYRARSYGLKVPTMGVALLVMWPVLYTDATDAYRLKNPRHRMNIAAAGMLVEVSVAIISTFLWVLLPDGVGKSIAFFFATTSWLSSFAVNLNPFMRFDGYFLLSDLFQVENLQDRSFTLAKWRLREFLFGLGVQPPGGFSKQKRRLLVVYAWSVWVYRFFLFLGIALLVYAFFFKVLGVLLFLVEIVWFIAMPIYKEVKAWWGLRMILVKKPRFYLSVLVFSGLVAACFVPWVSNVYVPAVWEYQKATVVHAPSAARVVASNLREDVPVAEGDVLLVLESPDLDARQDRLAKQLDVTERKLYRSSVSRGDLGQLRVLLREKASIEDALAGVEELQAKLVIRAPWAGVITSVEPGLELGRWVTDAQALAALVDPSDSVVYGMVDERDLERVHAGADGTFYPEDPEYSSMAVRLEKLRRVAESAIENPYLLSRLGGGVATSPSSNGEELPEVAVYRVDFITRGELGSGLPVALRGLVRLQSERTSLAQRLWRAAASVWVKESGF